jgi:hypothetical protein
MAASFRMVGALSALSDAITDGWLSRAESSFVATTSRRGPRPLRCVARLKRSATFDIVDQGRRCLAPAGGPSAADSNTASSIRLVTRLPASESRDHADRASWVGLSHVLAAAFAGRYASAATSRA